MHDGSERNANRIAIRDMQIDDANAIFCIIRDIYKEDKTPFFFDSMPDENEIEGLLATKLELSREGKCIDLVACDGQRVVGEAELVLKEEKWYIGMFVDKAVRRLGIGTSLLNELAKRAAKLGIANVYAEVIKSNEIAISFFEHNNFEECAVQGGKSVLLKKL